MTETARISALDTPAKTNTAVIPVTLKLVRIIVIRNGGKNDEDSSRCLSRR